MAEFLEQTSKRIQETLADFDNKLFVIFFPKQHELQEIYYMENAYKDGVGKENKGDRGVGVGGGCRPCGKFIRSLLLSRILIPTKRERSAAMGFGFQLWEYLGLFKSLSVFPHERLEYY